MKRLLDLPEMLKDKRVLKQLADCPSKTTAIIRYEGQTYTVSILCRPDLMEADYTHWPELGAR